MYAQPSLCIQNHKNGITTYMSSRATCVSQSQPRKLESHKHHYSSMHTFLRWSKFLCLKVHVKIPLCHCDHIIVGAQPVIRAFLESKSQKGKADCYYFAKITDFSMKWWLPHLGRGATDRPQRTCTHVFLQVAPQWQWSPHDCIGLWARKRWHR